MITCQQNASETSQKSDVDNDTVLAGVLVGLTVIAWYAFGGFLLYRCCFKKEVRRAEDDQNQIKFDDEQIYNPRKIAQNNEENDGNNNKTGITSSPL